MADNYRIKYKAGDFEMEIESTDKSFVESKMEELIVKRQANSPEGAKKITPARHNSENEDAESSDDNGNTSGIDFTKVANAINDSPKHDTIEKEIINKSNRLKRILLVLYFTHELYGQTPITTGDIEMITDQLGIRISQPNVASAIKENLKFFAADAVRKKGAIIKYKINKKGIDEIKSIIGE